MLNYRYVTDSKTNKQYIETTLTGKPLLSMPQLNKDTAFTHEERIDLGILGKLPPIVESIENQEKRAYQQYLSYETNLQRNIYLNNLNDQNHILFYRLVVQHLAEIVPYIYTPIVGLAIENFSQQFRRARGLYVNYSDRDNMDAILANRSNRDIDCIVVTDAEGVLGLGDMGVGGIDIPIAKLMLYTACGGIHPNRTLPILLGVGTDNKALQDDPLYLGLKHPRIRGKDYDEFVEKFVKTLKRTFGHVLVQWEDFGRSNARRILDKYRSEICSFNDDIQGTGAVSLAAVLAGARLTKRPLKDHRIVIFGAGSAGTGIADIIYDAMLRDGCPEKTARDNFWLIDRDGLIMEDMQNLTPEQEKYVCKRNEINKWQQSTTSQLDLATVIKNAKPTILVGCSTVHGAFTEEIIREMAKHVDNPIILPLSNPTEKSEAVPKDLFNWTDGRALVATGSPFATFEYHGRKHTTAQCNNALVFPGIGVGAIVSKTKEITDNMLYAVSNRLSQLSPALNNRLDPILPLLGNARQVAREVAIAVFEQALEDNVAGIETDNPEKLVDEYMWYPEYLPIHHVDKL